MDKTFGVNKDKEEEEVEVVEVERGTDPGNKRFPKREIKIPVVDWESGEVVVESEEEEIFWYCCCFFEVFFWKVSED